MRVIIDSTEVITKKGTSSSGRDYAFHHQVAYLDQGKRYPTEFKCRIDDPEKPWPVGEYTVDADRSTYIDKFGAPSYSDSLFLVPFPNVDASLKK